MICSFIEKDYSVEYKKIKKNKGVSKMSKKIILIIL